MTHILLSRQQNIGYYISVGKTIQYPETNCICYLLDSKNFKIYGNCEFDMDVIIGIFLTNYNKPFFESAYIEKTETWHKNYEMHSLKIELLNIISDIVKKE